MTTFNSAELASKYLFIKNVVSYCGYKEEIEWQDKLSSDSINESSFLKETAWVILSSGMKELIVRKLFFDISNCFYNWVSSKRIIKYEEKCLSDALKIFNNKPKLSAIIEAAKRINNIGFKNIKKMINSDPINKLQEFSFIGPVTAYHLAKNIGLNIAKPDRHLVRLSNQAGFSDVQSFCTEISSLTGDKISVIDIVFWRFATIENDYLNVFNRI